MCGITGFMDLHRSRTEDQLRVELSPMCDALRSRGPDDRGLWIQPSHGVALGHRRLAILDLTAAGHQPMLSRNGRWCLVYNGEIYNHQELRRDLEQAGLSFRGTSDTETLVEAIAHWGIAATLPRCRGIFALAAYDVERQELTLARDHLGVKPVYFGRQGSLIFFASELKALRSHPAFQDEIQREVLPQFFRHNYIPAPYSIYRGIEKLPAGSCCTISSTGEIERRVFWSLTDVARAGVANPLEGDFQSLIDLTETELLRSVREQMLSDVPLGAFLSGGIDSSLVVALMRQVSARPVQTFTIGFEIEHYNEAPFAAEIARHLETDHTECYVTAKQAVDVIPQLPSIYDEPFADSSQIPTYLVSKLARKHVTVALSGDGGDEIFCGYRRYFAASLGLARGQLPAVVRHAGSFGFRTAAGIAPAGRWRKFLQRASTFLQDADPDQRYLRGMTHWPLSVDLVRQCGAGVTTDFLAPSRWPDFPELQQRWMWLDTRNYLPDDILVKVDRASMAVSLETRVPLLDPKIVELAWRLPHAMKAERLSGKRILKEVLSRHVPRELFERPKMGFGVPIAEWLRGPLRDWGESLLNGVRLQREGYLNPLPIQAAWQDHVTGQSDNAYLLWDVLMFQAWLEESRN